MARLHQINPVLVVQVGTSCYPHDHRLSFKHKLLTICYAVHATL